MSSWLIQTLIIIFVIADTLVYLVGINRGKVKPVLATRLLLSFALVLSALTDFKVTGVDGLSSNILNLANVGSVIFITAIVLFKKDTRRTFTKFEEWCLGAVFTVFVLWLITDQNILANLSIQIILVIAYVPTLIQLWSTTQNTESLSAWTFDLLASTLGVIIPLQTMDLLPIVYGLRSVFSTLAVIVLILRLNYKNSFVFTNTRYLQKA